MIFNIQRYSTHDGPGSVPSYSLKAVRWAAVGVRTRKAAPAAKTCCMTRGCVLTAASFASRRHRR